MTIMNNHPARWLFLVLYAAGDVLFLLLPGSLKKVAIKNDQLILSNYLTTIIVPSSELKSVEERRQINIRPVWLRFRNSTEFGYRVVFMPKCKLNSFAAHPVVTELTELMSSSNTDTEDQ